MLTIRPSLLSASLVGSAWDDMASGRNGDSRRTALVKGESIGWINEMLTDPIYQNSDLTLIAICHLLSGEIWACNETTLRIHQIGIAKLIMHRGGMDKLQSQATAEVLAG